MKQVCTFAGCVGFKNNVVGYCNSVSFNRLKMTVTT